MATPISDEEFGEIVTQARKDGILSFEFMKLSGDQQERIATIISGEYFLFRTFSFEDSELKSDIVHSIATYVAKCDSVKSLILRGNDVEIRTHPYLGVIAGKPSANVNRRVVDVDDKGLRKTLQDITLDALKKQRDSVSGMETPTNNRHQEYQVTQFESEAKELDPTVQISSEMEKIVDRELPRYAFLSLALLCSNQESNQSGGIQRPLTRMEMEHIKAKNELCSKRKGKELPDIEREAYFQLFFKFHQFIVAMVAFGPMFRNGTIHEGNAGGFETTLLSSLHALGIAGSIAEKSLTGMSFGLSSVLASVAAYFAEKKIKEKRGKEIFAHVNQIDLLHLNGNPPTDEGDRVVVRFIVGCYCANGNISHIKHSRTQLVDMKTAVVQKKLDEFGHDYCVYTFIAITSDKKFAGVNRSGVRMIPSDRVITSKKKFCEISLGRVFFEIEKSSKIMDRLAQNLPYADLAARQATLKNAEIFCEQYQKRLQKHRDTSD